MRLRRLDLTRYGKFTDHSLDFGAAPQDAPDFHIVYGLNEAGKSTTFAAYLDLLFGMGDQNRYNFRHDYNAMQIGACLEFDGRAHELVRVKKRVNSLLDDKGQPVNEATLAAALGGITRDAYRTMFSLDDQSLAAGGNAIIQSKGELGELLFSASTGLAELSKVLLATAADANAIYKKRTSSTQLAQLKQRLEALKTERAAIDTFASTYAALTATHAQAETAYAAAMEELGKARATHATQTRLLGALPLANELASVKAKLDMLDQLPRPPAEWFQLLPQLSRDETRLQALLDSASRTIEQLAADIDALAVDDAVLAIGPQIRDLDEARARYRTAKNDLPKRRLAFAEQDAMLSAILAALEHGEVAREGQEALQALLLPASITGILRDLIETRSGIDARLESADGELTRSRDKLARLRDEAEALGESGDAIPADRLAAVEAALARLASSNLTARLDVEQRNGIHLRHAFEAQMAQLAPWTGDIATLAGLPGVEPRQIEMWRAEAAALDRRRAEHEGRRRELVSELQQMQARIAAFEAGGAIDDGQALNLRRDRDAAWQVHLERLDGESARAFAERLQRDDTLSAARLARAQDLAEMRQLQQAAAAQTSAIARQAELLAEATQETTVLAELIGSMLPAELTIGQGATGLGASGRVLALEGWIGRRSQALAAWQTLQQAEVSIGLLRAELDQQAGALAGALGQAGVAQDDVAAADDLVRRASALLAADKTQAAMRANHERARTSLERELTERVRDLDQASAAAAAWQRDWQTALAKTWFAEKAGSVASVREILTVLATLPGVLREREQLSQRIATMERDQAQFSVEIAALHRQLANPAPTEDVLAAADQLLARHSAALVAQHARQGRQLDLERALDDRRTLEEQLAVHTARKTELTAFFDTDTLAAVSLALDQVREKERLEERAETLRQQIAEALRTTSHAEASQRLAAVDAADVERQAIELAARIDDLTESSKQLFADVRQAKARLDAVGGDDAVARIEAQRRTIFLEIEECALRYLTLKTGTSAAEQALHLYRDRHRSSMMTRASNAFRLITGGHYSGLTTRLDKDREILIGMGRDGSSKLADHMSTGTQFQLYLALRLAGYEEFALVRPPVPFIADDIMESFDNPRSEEVFRLLGEMARVGQVIYLTHHWHLCEIASAVVPGVKIHQLP